MITRMTAGTIPTKLAIVSVSHRDVSDLQRYSQSRRPHGSYKATGSLVTGHSQKKPLAGMTPTLFPY